MAALRWMILFLLAVSNLIVLAWLLGLSSWMPFPHETPKEPERINQELRANSLTVLPGKTKSTDAPAQ